MRYPGSEKLEIIRLVEDSQLPTRPILAKGRIRKAGLNSGVVILGHRSSVIGQAACVVMLGSGSTWAVSICLKASTII
jgi:hypothetical protein